MNRRTPAIETAPDQQATYPDATKGYIPTACDHEQCGQPQSGPGRPRKGWVQTKAASEPTAIWHCSWHCASRYAIRRELRGAA